MGDFEVKDEDLAGRIGVLETKHGKIETPVFFPVINVLKSEININDVINIGFNNFITNAYILNKNNLVKDDIHKELNSSNVIIMTDSGAYQILQYGDIEISNREIVEYQNRIKPDIGVILDIPTGKAESESEAKYSVEETIRRAKEVEDIISSSNDIIWTHPIQGGTFVDLLKYSARKANENEKYKMLALGSPTVIMQEYNYTKLIDMIHTVRSNISRGKPLHLFGGGVPHIIPFAIALGVDSFDSASYILYARDNRYITRSRTLRLDSLEYFPCSCPVCSRYSPKDLLEMEDKDRVRLLAIHNLYKILEEIRETKIAIKEGRLFEYLQEKAYSHPAVYSAFLRLLKYNTYLEKYDPRVKGEVKGMLLYDSNSLYRPEILRHDQFMLQYKPKHNTAIVICYDNLGIPFISDDYVKDIVYNYENEADIFIAIPFYGLIPVQLSESFPLSQFEIPTEIDDKTLQITSNKISNFIKNKYKEIKIFNCDKSRLHIMSI
ncbi:tRNA guanosine(15) transglycosylase TgtA [Acidianus sulfidivorans JP7]|uniref:tRNA-guanine(15) transglycosylase n=1 Tax=Acidianus sulfidivorans JP7 TaxID=619593 RepID=A0A2U9IQG4_9CREN|nr:tRNA guanosine(15) transglycosylase TgtA [Acidianus sulfidivorans]AWR98265.1 tRNA guanosine(15) transglycosylase TgtA [Acidianus sulfidivorans JP7]